MNRIVLHFLKAVVTEEAKVDAQSPREAWRRQPSENNYLVARVEGPHWSLWQQKRVLGEPREKDRKSSQPVALFSSCHVHVALGHLPCVWSLWEAAMGPSP